MLRQDVYRMIDGERDHQDRKWGCPSIHPHEVGGWLEIIRGELEEAAQAWRKAPDDLAALDEVRQIAAVAVACLEQHGCRPR